MRPWLLLLPLAACAAEPASPTPNAWIGATELDLVTALGVPSRTYEAEGRRFLAYDETGSPAPAIVPSFGFGMGSASGGWGSGTAVGTGIGLSFGPYGGYGPCTTSFEIANGFVVAASRQPPGCR
jgi:hypothetical protein